MECYTVSTDKQQRFGSSSASVVQEKSTSQVIGSVVVRSYRHGAL